MSSAPRKATGWPRCRTELDQYWDLLRQRRARREFGFDPSEAHARDADVVKKYIG